MHIIIDGSSVLRKIDGIGRVSAELFGALISQHPEHTYEIVGFSDQKNANKLIQPANNVSYTFLPIHSKLYNGAFKLGIKLPVNRLLSRKPDTVVYPNFVAKPYIKNVRKILIVHDVAYLDQPGTLTDRNRKYLYKFIPKSIAECDMTLAISNYTAVRISDTYGVKLSDIGLVLPAVSSQFQVTNSDSILDKYDLDRGYILSLGTIEPRKNIDTLITAYLGLSDSLRSKHQLVLAGRPGWKTESLVQRIADAKSNGENIQMTGFIDDEDLADLYRLAAVSVQISHYEGFGIPPIESMTVGTPVVANPTSALVEALGDAAETVSPENPEDVTKALTRVLTDERLRTSLVKRGYVQAKKFSWNTSAKNLAKYISKQ